MSEHTHDHNHDHDHEGHEHITLIDDQGNETLYEILSSRRTGRRRR